MTYLRYGDAPRADEVGACSDHHGGGFEGPADEPAIFGWEAWITGRWEASQFE